MFSLSLDLSVVSLSTSLFIVSGECIVRKSNAYLMIMDWCAGEWREIGTERRAGKIRSQHLQGANIIGSQKECLRAWAVVNSPFVSQGPAISAIVPLFREGIGFFFFLLSVVFLPSSAADFPCSPMADLIRTFLSDLFTKGHRLYLWPIRFEWKRTMASQKKS